MKGCIWRGGFFILRAENFTTTLSVTPYEYFINPKEEATMKEKKFEEMTAFVSCPDCGEMADLVINLHGGPGTGKSTTAAHIFALYTGKRGTDTDGSVWATYYCPKCEAWFGQTIQMPPS
jgi:ssDNA-binding Zn-finger/Zn-ribbon topoisomerase 1